MRLETNQKKRLKRLSLTPLIDVVFLLLIFFLLSSTFLKFNRIPVQSSEVSLGSSIKPENTMVILIKQNNVLWINESKVTNEGLHNALDLLRKKGEINVFIKPEQGVSTQATVNVLQIVRSLKIKNVMLVR